jgi:hypothetical protein
MIEKEGEMTFKKNFIPPGTLLIEAILRASDKIPVAVPSACQRYLVRCF